jgi:hypothetical protein
VLGAFGSTTPECGSLLGRENLRSPNIPLALLRYEILFLAHGTYIARSDLTDS